MQKNHKLMDKYDPKQFEQKLYKEWDEKGYFKPSMDKAKPSYSIVMPPPNVTGKLHMGHALDAAIQDLFIRYKRMQGYNTLWLPGTDHSALSTEAKIVAQMKEEGLKKSDIGRAKFLDRAWDWTKLYGGTIVSQQKMLGCSCDWSRARFTLDEGLSKAVYTAFKRLYDKGYIYKGKRMINYCTGCHTSISDAEIEYKEEATHLWHIKYQVKDSDEYLVVATTRPETMLGDTAVAVNPKDERLKHLIGKTCILPIMNKEIPIIGDRFVEMEFGTGAVKVTPAHDMNDYQAGLDHDLPVIEVFDENLVMNDLHPDFAGMNIYDARTKIVERLQEIGALIKIEDYTHNVAKCDRCHSTIEPRISDQWFVKMSELAKPAIEAVKNDDVKFIPKRYEKTFFNWMNNIKDWCISRQIWWGHQLPVYYCEDCGEIVVLDKTPDKCPKCGCTKFTRDEDTLDTWFSSALWPFSTLGWPNENAEDYKTFYPTDTLVTGYDIIQAWVSRMIYSGLEYTGKKPFDNVFIHGIVRDSQGRKMSKSLGNGIDPLEVIDEYSTDALRFSLILGITAGNDIRYMPEKLESSSNFANKLWNASKFVLMNLEDYDGIYDEKDLCKEDKWILSKLNTLVKEVTNNIDNFDIGVSTQKIYDFIWNEFCDWYIEICKTRLYDKTSTTRKAAQFTLNKVLQDSLKLLHPVMPFITEEIYTKLYNDDETIMTAEWPKFEEKYAFQKEEQEIEKLKDVIIGIRNIRNNMNVHPSRKSKLIVVTENYKNLINESESILNKLGFAESIELKNNKNGIPSNAVSVVTDGIEVFMPFEDLVDLEAEKERLQNEKTKLESEVARATKMLSNPGFVNKAPEAKINEEKAKLVKYQEMLDSVNERLKNI
ncbi:MAG TPA: valine--tRNA ligase [Clostridiaceae bacterium]|nr:valine--tRNA ligase [Clostridiaceae bacterium]